MVCPFGSIFIMIVLIGNQRRNDEEDEEVVSGTYQGEVGEEEEDEENDSGDGDGKTTKHPCGNMSQSLEEGEGVEPQNLHAPIVE